MERNKIIEKRINISIIIIMFIIAIISVVCLIFGDVGTKIKINEPKIIKTAWIKDGRDVSLPYRISTDTESVFILTNVVPNYIDDSYAISFLSNYALNEVFIDDKLIYSYGETTKLPFSKMTGNIRCIVPLKSEYIGHEINIRITYYYNSSFEFDNVYCDTINNIYLHILKINLWRIIIIPIILIIAIISLCIALMNKSDIEVNILFYFSLFASCMASWLFASSDIPQFITSSNTAISFISFVSLTAMCIFFAAFCREFIYSKKREIFLYFECLGVVFISIQTILFLLSIIDPIELTFLIHIYMGIILISSTYCIFKENDKTEYQSAVLQVILFFTVFVVLALISFYKHPGSGKDGIIIAVGFTFFIFSLFYIIILIEINEVREMSELKIYRELAFKDGLTGLRNRAALEKQLNELNLIVKNDDFISFIMFDLNFLKKVNDNIGHNAGDELIISTANIIDEVFGDIGYSYRLGGDEFAVIAAASKDTIDKKIEQLNKIIDDSNKLRNNKISIAFGHSTKVFNNEDKTLKMTLYKDADDKMYQMKEKQHKKIK